MSDNVPTPQQWLWAELERLLISQQLDELRAGYVAASNAYMLQQRLEHCRQEIGVYEQRRALAEAHGEDVATIRRLERKIAHRRAYLAKQGATEKP